MGKTVKKSAEKARPKHVRTLVMALNSGKQLDQRTTSAKAIKEVKRSLRENLDETARCLLEHDVAIAAVIQKMAHEQAMKDPNKAIRPDGKPCYALNSWAKFGNIKKGALLALRKFQPKEQQQDDNKGLAEMVLEVSEEDVSP
jgi:hypothetical protein